MRVAFGTDGVRGVANTELTPELALAIGRAATRVLGRGPFVVGRDTRVSGPLLQAALSAGLASEGADVVDVGVLPTPAVATVAAQRGLCAAVVSASHNPFPDNGVKLFSAGGGKLPDAVEARVEEELDGILVGATGRARPSGDQVGRLLADPEAGGAWASALAAALEGRRLDGLGVVLDCANGAASAVTPRVIAGLGARLSTMAAEPDGANINDHCGSTHPESLQQAVRDKGADIGLALDGDADRLVAVDETGRLVDGDQIMAILARDLHSRGMLAGDTVAVTVYSNLGFRLAMESAGVHVHETPVGDKHVLAALDEHGWVLGGEQSGHIILRHLAPTGDGTLTGLALMDVMVRTGSRLSELADRAMTRLPQALASVRVNDPSTLAETTGVWSEVADVEASLAGRGRVVLRASGTEPVVRVMVEADDEATARAAADRLCATVAGLMG